MKHLFSFRQRPNETLTHSTTRGLNGSRMVVETTVKGRSNDCRMTLGRLSTLFLLLFALSFGFNQEAWSATTSYTIYFCPGAAGKSWTTPYVNCNKGWSDWQNYQMNKASFTFHGFDVYQATIATHDGGTGFDEVSFHASKDNWDGQLKAPTGWPFSYGGKIYDGSNWQNKAEDSEQTFYFCPKVAGKDWTTPYANCNLGYNNWSNVQMTEVSGKTFCGQKVYQATVTTCAFDKIEFHKSSSDYSGKIELSNPSGVNGKLYNGSEWKTFNYDTEYTFYFATDWSAVYANCNLGYNIWKDLAMTNTGKTYNGKKIYSITVVAQGFNDIEFHKSQGGDWDSKVVGYSNSTTYKKDFTNALCTSANNWVAYNYDVTLTFDPKNGGATTNKVTLKGGSITAPSAPSKTGYTFQGWGTSKVAAGGTISNVQADATYDAQWTPNTNTPYTVKHYKQNLDGTYPSTATETENLTGTTDASVTPAVKSYTGFTAPSTQTKTIVADGSLVVEYKYTRNSHTLTWNANGGTIDGKATKEETLKYGATITVPQTSSLSYSGHNFTGWNTTPASTMPDNDVTYTAQWEVAATATVTYDGNGYTGGTVPTDATTYAPGATVTVLTGTPEKTGYNFNGWKNSDGGAILSAGSQFTISSSVTLTAQWEIVNYSITYNGLEGGTHTNPANYTIETATITLTDASRDNYTFDGWYDAETGGNKVTQITIGSTGNKTLWARWSETLHSVNIVSGTGIESVSPAGATNVGNVTPVQISATVKAGYTWKNWTTDNSSNVTITDANANPTTIKATGSTNVTANATENKTTVTVSSNNSTWGTVSPTSANVGVSTSRQVTATPKPGYKFVSWTLDGGARLASGALTNAQITIKGDGSSATGTAVATFAEDLSSNWYLAGTSPMFPNGWNTGETNMMKRATGHSTENVYYFTIHVNDADIATSQSDKYQFKIHHYKTGTGACDEWFGWGNTEGSNYWVNQTCTTGIYKGNNNLYFIPTIAGDYEFKVDATNGADVKLTVTWPSYNCVYGEFDSWNKDTHKLEFAGGDEASTVVNITNISKSYEFLVLVNSNYFTNTASFTTPITRSTASNVAFAAKGGSGNNSKFTPDVAGDYTFTYNKSTNKLTITYPALPTASTTATEKRMFNESELSFISGNGTEANPYKIYTDEALTIDITALAAQTNLTAKYQFGEDAATTDVLTKTIINPSIEKTSILIKAFYESDGVAGTAWEKTIWYQGVPTPTLHLTTSWSSQNDEAQEGSDVPANVIVYYSTTNYNGPATVTRSKDGAEAETFFTVPNGTTQKNETYNLPDQNVQRQTFVATATANGRTFTATKAISVYRLVEIIITDAHHLMDHYYMWEAGTTPTHEEAAWPGNNFVSTLGNAHIFYVKYPSYTDFVLNNGRAATEDDAAQTIDVTVPNQSTCYTIGEKITTEGDDKGKYDVQEAAQCPNKLYVGDIADVSAVQGEGVIVSPQVDIDPLLDANNLTISFNYGSTQGITCDQRGRSFMVTATAGTGTYEIQVTYSIPGADPITKPVTINVTSAIMIQAKYGNLGWSDHNEIYIHYWGTDINATQKMTWKDYVGEAPNKQDRVYARIPLGSNNQINFQIYAWNMDEAWHVTEDVNDVTTSGCYTISYNGDNNKRSINREGNNCWTAYYVEIDMNNGTVYRSNTVEDLTKQVSFFAPGSSESQAKAGAVRIICNGSQTAVVNAATFTKSGIYTAKITANGDGLSDVAPYTGDYYIRTDAAEGGWNDYVKDSHKFTYFTPYEGALYDYYWVMNKKVNNQGDKLNIKGCVGNGINDNLANMIEASNYTDGYGDITPDAGTGVNLRFGYNPETNYFERSILRGSTAGESNFLNIVGDNIYNDKSCSEELNEANYKDNPEWSKFGDISNWVYEKNIYVEIDGSHPIAQALLKSKAFNGTTIYQLGYTLDNFGRQTGTPAQRNILGLGTTRGTYNLRIIYDFKTNRIVSAWSPVGDVTYSTPTTIEADVLFVRHEDTPVAQVKLDNDAALVSELNSAYFVMEIDGASQKLGESMYWFSVPFDCEISSIFGVEGYVTLNANGIPTAGTWGIQEYDGETRAQKGWYIEDTQTFWRWKHKSEKLLKGNGYILVFDRTEANNQNLWKEITREEPCEGTDGGCQDGKKTVTTTILRLYFPSSESGWDMTRSDKEQWVEYPDWTCTKPNRKAQDSNWRLLGTNSYSNIKIDEETQFERRDDGEMLDKAPNFVYVYDRTKDVYNRYEPVTSVGKDFLSFNCYMVQFSGRINWNQYTQSEKEGGTLVAARRVVAENELTNAQMTLSLKKGNNTEDNTYIYMDTRATTDFDNQMDLTKITDTRANQIYSVTNEVEYAGNTLPVEDQIVPLTVNVNANGAYTFAMPEMTDGLEVYLMDNATNAHIDMAIDSYTVDLNKGKIADRFYLDVRVKERTTPTIIETIGSDGNPTGDRFIKVIQNDQLHIIRNGRIYNASGMELNR